MAEEWAEIICDEEDIPPAMNADEVINYWQEKLSRHDEAVIRTNELLAEEHQINAGLRTMIANHAETIGNLQTKLQKQKDIAAVAIVGCVFLALTVAYLIFTS